MTVDMIQPTTLGASLGLYSHVAFASCRGSIISVAGQVGVTPSGELAGDGSIEDQTRQAFENVGLALAAVGATFADVLKTTTYIVGRPNVDGFMAARRGVFESLFPDERYPPNTLLLVAGLVEVRFVVEVEALAVTSEDLLAP